MEGDSSSGHEGESFIPGIPDDITLEHIVTKVSWRTLFVLASLNRAWNSAIQKREAYDVRMRTRSTQSLVAFSVRCHRQQGFYDLEQQWMHLLPALPRLHSSRSPGNVQTAVGTVMLDGKLFVLGDFSYELGSEVKKRREVHVLDLGACRLVWKPCSSTRIDTGSSSLCVACAGKIYAFSMRDKLVHGEVFDPKNDQWTRIVDKPLNVCVIFGYDGRVATLNREIYVCSFGEKIMVFNSSTERWRELKNTIPNKKSVSWVVIGEKLYNLSDTSVDVYDPSSNSWAVVQPIFTETFRRKDTFRHDPGITPYPITVGPFGDEVLALLEHDITFSDGSCRKLCKSVGFGRVGHPLVWEVLSCSDLQTSLNIHNNFFLGSIEL